MPENLKSLRRRIRSVRTTKQVTRAMEMVSAAKLRRAQSILQSARPYAGKMREILHHLAETPEASTHPLFSERPEGDPALIVLFTSDRGLCGSFNANLIHCAEEWVDSHRARGGASPDLICVGRKGADAMRRAGASILRAITDLSGRVDASVARSLAAELADLFLQRPYSSVQLVYADFISNVQNRPAIEQFLPVRISSADPIGPGRKSLAETSAAPTLPASFAGHPVFAEAPPSYLLEPTPSALFSQIVPQYLYSRIFIVMAEAMTSEHSARMMAMNNATSNCEELLNSLTLRMNKARQSAITKEMLEIVSGAEALKG